MSQPPKLLRFRIIIANLPKSVFLKRKPAEFWHPIKDLLRSVPTKTRNQVTGQADAEIFEPEKCDVDVSRRAFCPYKDAKEAWEAYHYLQGYLWSLDGYQSVLVVRLYKVDASGRAHRLAGPDEDDIESTYPSSVSSSASSVTSSGAATIRQPPVRSYIPAGYIGKIPPQYGQGKRSIDQHKQLGSDPASDMSLNSYVSSPYMASGNSEPATQPLGLHIPSQHQCCTPPTPLNSPYSIAIEVPNQRPGPEVFTPALTSTSRNSSISSISTAFLSSTASNCTTTSNFHASSSISSSATAIHGLSQAYTSSRTLPEPESRRPDAYKIRVQGVKAGVSEVQFHKDVLEKKFGIYTQHAGIEIVNRDGRPYVYVGYHSKNGAKKAVQELNNFKFMGKKLQVQLE